MLKTKSIIAPKEETDGTRISTMSRHTLEDGITPNPQITRECYDFWIKDLGPSGKIVGAYHRGELSWENYERKYLRRIRENDKIAEKIKLLARVGLTQDITILCVEKSPEHCHRKLLAEECKRYEPDLVLDIQ